jgi:hypothetical protein
VNYVTTVKGGGYYQNTGSIAGGTLLWIKGNGFASNGFSTQPSTATTNVVQLVQDNNIYDCNIHPEEVSDTQLACYTPAMPPGSYLVRIYVNGYLIPLTQYTNLPAAQFISSASYTPTITGITPATGFPQRLLSLSGDFKSQCYSQDVTGCSSDNTPLISR